MVNVNNVDDLIAIISVIRPGAARLEPVEYVHPSLERALRSTYGVVAYEEHILQICEDFAGLSAGRADILRRALVKGQQEKIMEIGREFIAAAQATGRIPGEIKAVWTLVCGFQGYAFCRAHSTAYGVEAYEAAWLKRHHPAEFLAAVLTNGKGFYSKLVYSIECRRLGLGFRSPDVNHSRNHFFPEGNALRVPLFQIKGLSQRLLAHWERGKPYESTRDFYLRTTPSTDEMDHLIRTGAFDAFDQSRTEQFWQFKELAQWPAIAGQRSLLAGGEKPTLPDISLEEPSLIERLKAEQDILGFPVTDHPLALFPDVRWDSYCPITNLKDNHGKRVTIAGLIIEDRIHRQEDGRPMKFISVCDATGIIKCELFADVYRRFGIETVRNPVVEIVGKVMPFANGHGHTLQVQRVAKARSVS